MYTKPVVRLQGLARRRFTLGGTSTSTRPPVKKALYRLVVGKREGMTSLAYCLSENHNRFVASFVHIPASDRPSQAKPPLLLRTWSELQ